MTFGYGWRFTDAPDLNLHIFGDGSVWLYGSDGNVATYANNGTPTPTPPPGMNATLTHNGDGTWTLAYAASARRLTFRSDGLLAADADRNGVSYTYSYPPNVPTTYNPTVTGTRGGGNPVTLGYGGPGTCSATTGQICGLTQTADGVTRSVSFGYDGTDDLTTITEHSSASPPAGDAVTRFGYDANHQLTGVTDPKGVTTTVGYLPDATFRVSSLDQDSGAGHTNATTSYDYTSSPGHTYVHDADSGAPYSHGATDYTVDGFARVGSVTDPLGRTRATSYSPNNDVTSAADAMSPANATNFTYNGGNDLTMAQQPTGASASASYNTPGQPHLPDSATDLQGNKTSIGYDTPGNLARLTPAGGAAPQTFSYNPPAAAPGAPQPPMTCGGTFGQRCSATDGNNHTTNYGYDATGNLTRTSPPAGATLAPTQDSYYQSGATQTVTDGKGQVTSYLYDGFGRLSQARYGGASSCLPASCVSYGYDADGNTTSRTDATGTTSYGYDTLNRLTAKTLPAVGTPLTLSYDPIGNVLTYADTGGTVGYSYDAANELRTLLEPGTGGSCAGVDLYASPPALPSSGSRCTAFHYNNNAQRDQTGYPGGTVQALTPDGSGRVTEIKATANGTTLTDLAYGYAKSGADSGLTQSRTDKAAAPNLTTGYGYDPLNRLATASESNGSAVTGYWLYCYDQAGNRSYDSTTVGATGCPGQPGGPAPTYAYDPANALTSHNGAGSGYDADGNETAGTGAGARTNETYNAANQLLSLTSSGTGVSFGYAGASNAERTQAGATGYQNGPEGLASQRTGAAGTYFTRDPKGTPISERTATGSYYYLSDALGSVVGLVDNTGARTNTYNYDPYGNSRAKTEGVANPLQYTGGYLDGATGLYHLGLRYYDPTLGRFTQPDPTGQEANAYVYAGDNPTNNIDPTGQFFFSHTARRIASIGYKVVSTVVSCAIGAATVVQAAEGPEVFATAVDPLAGAAVTIGAAVTGCALAVFVPGAI